MGCCQSSETSDEHASPSNPGSTTIHPSSSTRHITPASTSSLSTDPRQSHPSLRHSRSNISSTTPSRPSTTRRQRNLTEHYSLPFRPHPWTSPPSRRWTRSQLERERADFFDTRVSGRSEVWDAIRGATEYMRAGELETARAIVNAAGLIITNGDLVEGGYDQQGALYRVPEHIVQDPDNVLEDSPDEPQPRTDGSDAAPTDITEPPNPDSGLSKEGALPPTPLIDKGKSPEPTNPIRVRCRLSDRIDNPSGGGVGGGGGGNTDITIPLGRNQNVAALKRRLYTEAGVDASRYRLRIAYLGRMLSEKTPLEEQGWREGHVLNALVVPVPASERGERKEDGAGKDGTR